MSELIATKKGLLFAGRVTDSNYPEDIKLVFQWRYGTKYRNTGDLFGCLLQLHS
jgi:hypothetical protein